MVKTFKDYKQIVIEKIIKKRQETIKNFSEAKKKSISQKISITKTQEKHHMALQVVIINHFTGEIIEYFNGTFFNEAKKKKYPVEKLRKTLDTDTYVDCKTPGLIKKYNLEPYIGWRLQRIQYVAC